MSKVEFTKEMKKDYTILIPNMLPVHFKLISRILISYGYKAELVSTTGKHIADTGQKYVHNDICYPAILVIGQLIDALQSGKYDVHKTALLITQTGGGCRASNYIFLLRKALEKAGLGFVPVISLNFTGTEKSSGFHVTVPMFVKLFCAALYGDLLMTLKNQTLPYEEQSGETMALVDSWAEQLVSGMDRPTFFTKKTTMANYKAIIGDFVSLKKHGGRKMRVGIVGEIYVKFSPLGNNDLENFLLSEDCEIVMSGLFDFGMYCVYNMIADWENYGDGTAFKTRMLRRLYGYLLKMQKQILWSIEKYSEFSPPCAFSHVVGLTDGYISTATKMGEGWLLPAEMLELIDQGVDNIVCAQPFGCLPNHICGRGMMKIIKDRHPDVNLVAIDYDPGATKVNQENRIKLMLAIGRDKFRAADEAV